MNPESPDFWVTLGVGGVLAAMTFYYYRLLAAQYLADTKQYGEALKTISESMLQLVKDNVAALTTLNNTVAALHKRLDEERDIQELRTDMSRLLASLSEGQQRRADESGSGQLPVRP